MSFIKSLFSDTHFASGTVKRILWCALSMTLLVLLLAVTFPIGETVHAQDEEPFHNEVMAAEEVECADNAQDRLEISCFFDAEYGGCMTKALEFVRLWPQAGNARIEMTIQAHCTLGLGEKCGKSKRDHAHVTLCFFE